LSLNLLIAKMSFLLKSGLLKEAKAPKLSVIPNEFLFSLLSNSKRKLLREVDMALTRSMLEMDPDQVSNEISFGTQYVKALDTLALHGVTKEKILELQKKYLIIWPWSSLYCSSKVNQNQVFIQFPLAIVLPKSSREVSKWIEFVNFHKFSVSIRSGGHCYENFSISGQIVIDTSLLELQKELRNPSSVLIPDFKGESL